MIKLLRFLMIALLALAIPVQGVAAATMLYCGPDHGPGTDGVHAHQAAGPAQAHEAHQAHEGHGHGVHEHAQPDAQDAGLTQLPGTPDQPAQAKCSVCAACCNAVAISSPVVLPSPPGAEPVPVLKPSTLPYSFITDGPRRPPRSFLV